MTEKKIKHYEELLLTEKQKVYEEIMENNKDTIEIISEEERNVNDYADYASNVMTQTILSSISKNIHEKMKAIDAAFERIIEGSYGVCVVCEEKISDVRLEAIPWATTCVDCKKKTERRVSFV